MPKTDETAFRVAVKHWLLDHGELTYADLAKICKEKSRRNFAAKTIRQALTGTYHGDTMAVKQSISEATGIPL